MKRCPILLSIIVGLLLFSSSTAQTQTRPRRVGQGAPPTPTTGTVDRAPVLGNTPSKPGGSQKGAPAAKNGPEEVDSNDILRINTTLVTIPVSVMERDGRYVPNLRKEDFRLWEDGVEQQIAYFATVDKPFNVVLMLDTSQSTRFKLEEIQDAAMSFVNQLQPDDRVMVLTFDDKIRVLTDFTNDRRRMRDAILKTRPGNGTKLYDAVDMVINQKLDPMQGKKAIVLFTDGVDTTSRHASYESTMRDAEELDALIFPVQYDTYAANAGGGQYPGGGWPGGGWPRSSGNIWIDILGNIGRSGRIGRTGNVGIGSTRREYEIGDRYLHDLADVTGARLYQADSTYNLSAAFGNVAEELRRQYSLGYYPKNQSQTGQRHSIRVRTTQPNLAVRARDSYIFNPQSSATATQSTQAPPVLQKKLSARTNWP